MTNLDDKAAPSVALRAFLVALLAVAAAAIGITVFIANASFNRTGQRLAIGDAAPEITADGWVNGEPTDSEAGGRVVFVHAWETECVHCLRRAPELKSLYDRFHDRGVEFIGLTPDEEDDLDAVEEFVDETGMVWPNGYGARKTLERFGIPGFPAGWVIDRDGRVLWDIDSGGDPAEAIERALQPDPGT
jgi:thiol-disulfide isomerase/thioredoxin